MTKVNKKFLFIIGFSIVFLFLSGCSSTSSMSNRRKKVKRKKIKIAPCGCPKHAVYFVKKENLI